MDHLDGQQNGKKTRVFGNYPMTEFLVKLFAKKKLRSFSTKTSCLIGVTANSTESTYPVGTYKWQMTGFDGCKFEPYSSLLTLTSCSQQEFTCFTGECISMEQRWVKIWA